MGLRILRVYGWLFCVIVSYLGILVFDTNNLWNAMTGNLVHGNTFKLDAGFSPINPVRPYF